MFYGIWNMRYCAGIRRFGEVVQW